MKTLIFLLLFTPFFATAAKEEGKKELTEKTPKSLFLIKKAKINSDVGEPQYYPSEAQLKMITYDKALHDIKKFE